MTRLYLLIINIIIVLSLAGCGVASVAMLVLSLPGGVAPPQQVEISGYTLGPVSSDEFPALLHNAIPASLREVHFFGHASWSGLQNGERFIEAVAAITDTDILLLMWHEPENQYTLMTQLPYSEILSISAAIDGARTVYLYFDDREVSLGDQNFKLEGKTKFDFINPSGFRIDREKNEAAFTILKEHIKLHEVTRPTSDTTIEDDF